MSQTRRFKVAVFVNLISFYETSPAPDVFEAYLGGTPFTKPALCRERFPIFNIDKIQTPLLILHGEKDHGVPVSQTHEFYRALKKIGIESKCFIYPAEGHSFRDTGNQVDSLQRILAWYKKYRFLNSTG